MHRFAGVVGAGAGNDFDAAGGVLNGGFHHRNVLFYAQRGRFAGGAHGHNAVGAGIDVPVDELFELLKIHTAIFVHGGNNGH